MEFNEYNCKICNKKYKSYQSLWNHNKKFHNPNVVVCSSNEVVSDVVCGTLINVLPPILMYITMQS